LKAKSSSSDYNFSFSVALRTGFARFSTHLSLDDNVTLSCESRRVEMVIVEVKKRGFVLLIVCVGADKLAV
jgi:hypothetical protein